MLLNPVRLLAVAALLAMSLPAGAADLLDGPRVSSHRSGGGYAFVGRAPSFVFTTGYPYPHAAPYFIGPSPACAWLDVPVPHPRDEWTTRRVYRCW